MSFLENFSTKDSKSLQDYLVAQQLQCLERRLALALEQNLHSVEIDHEREIPLIDDVKRQLERVGFQYLRNSKLRREWIFFPHVANPASLLQQK